MTSTFLKNFHHHCGENMEGLILISILLKGQCDITATQEEQIIFYFIREAQGVSL